MDTCWSRLGGMILAVMIFFPATIVCLDQAWTGYHYQHQPSTTLWTRSSYGEKFGVDEDLMLQSSVRRPSYNNAIGKVEWKNPLSKPQWQNRMYKPKWQDPLSKPQWQVSKVNSWKPFSYKNRNVPNKQLQNGWHKRSHSNFNTQRVPKPAMPRFTSPLPAWPEYIPPLSIIKPSMDDPHALYNFKR